MAQAVTYFVLGTSLLDGPDILYVPTADGGGDGSDSLEPVEMDDLGPVEMDSLGPVEIDE